jgi:hypothetical protein
MPTTQASARDRKLEGFQDEDKITIDARRWESVRRILLRMMIGWQRVQKETTEVLATCRHAPGCPGASDETASCFGDCPDRETRLSMLVALGNARVFTENAPNLSRDRLGGYIPPTREYFDKLFAELETLRAAVDWVKAAEAGAAVPHDVAEDAKALGFQGRPMTRLLPSGDDEEEPDDEEPEGLALDLGEDLGDETDEEGSE